MNGETITYQRRRPQNPQSVYCRTVEEVRDAWAARTGQRLTRARVWQILRAAEKKVERGLRKAGATV